MKRIISILLIICMSLQIMSVTAVASDNDPVEATQESVYGNFEEYMLYQAGLMPSLMSLDDDTANSPVSLNSNSSTTRDTVLLLDNSVSMEGTPLVYLKQAAIKFCDAVLSADGINRVAIVVYDTTVSNSIGFSDDLAQLSGVVNNMDGEGSWTDINVAVEEADKLLSESSADIKNIIVMTDGVPTHGDYLSSGRYSYDDYPYTHNADQYCYEYANALYNTATALHDEYSIYSLGFFHNVSSDTKAFAVKVLKDIQNAGYYEVTNVDDLEFVFGDIADDVTGVGNKFNFAGALEENHDSSAEYYYTDEYFFTDPDDYNSSLSTMSLCLELSTWSSYDYDAWYNPNLTKSDDAFWKDKLVNVKTLLLGSPDEDKIQDGYGGIGFDHFAANSFWEEVPQKDSIGVVAARKQITDESTGEDYTLVAVVVRGGGYGNEWASNVTVGNSGDHQGFADARDKVLEFLRDEYLPYLEDDESKNIKLWIVGYSRAGATANMVAGAINEGYSLPHNISDVYCYAFAAPMGVLGNNISGTHNNIHNVINLNDIVPYVAPYKWGFERYNQDKDYTLPTAATTKDWDDAYEAMINELEKLGYSESDYVVPETSTQQNLKIDKSKFLPGGDPLWWWENSEVNTQYILTDGVDFLADDVLKSRNYYAENLQYVIRQIMGVITHYYGIGAGLEDYAGEVFDLEQFMQNMSELFTMDNIVYIISPVFSLNPFYSYDERVEDVKLRLMEKMGSIFREYAEIDGFIDALAEILVDVILQVASDAWDNNTDSVNLVIKFVDVLMGGVLNAHYPEICLAWVRSQDPNYNKQFVDDGVNSSITRIIRINCPVNINVYDENGVLVASIIDDVVVDNLGSIICLINNKGEKIVYLPGDGEYSIDIIATDDGYVSYAVDEFNYIYGTETRIENYYDVSINTGDILKALVPEIPSDELSNNSVDGSSVTYVLEDSDANPIPADSSYRGDQINDIYYTVSLVKEGNSGYITGAGTFAEGRFAEVEAQVLPSGEFLGWYENGVLVSADLTYRFAVRQDITLTAKFTDVTFHELKIESTAGGTVSSVGGYYSEGVEVAIVAEPDEGYVFDYWTTSNGGTLDDPNNPSVTFTIPSNETTVTAHFKSSGNNSNDDFDWEYWYWIQMMIRNQEFTIEATANEGGSITPNGESKVKYGNNLTYTITPLDGYEIISVIVDGKDIGAVTEYTFKNVTKAHTISAVFAKLPWQNPFIDVFESDWFYDDVKFVNEEGLMIGVSTNEFGPAITLNRATIVTTLWRLTGSPIVELDTDFTDLPDDWYTAAMKWAISEGIILGYGDDTCRPMTEITHEQVVAILHRFMVSRGYEDKPTTLSTQFIYSEWAENDVLWAIENNLFDGFGSDISDLTKTANRAEIAAYLHRLCELIGE